MRYTLHHLRNLTQWLSRDEAILGFFETGTRTRH